MDKKIICVTGGCGFIGSHVVEELIKQGHVVIVYDNLSTGKNLIPKYILDNKNLVLVKGDIRNRDELMTWMLDCDYVIHLAALKSVPKSFKNIKEYNEVNIQGTVNVLTVAKQTRVKNVVFASSSSVYGNVTKFPQKEDVLSDPLSPYALTKLAGEKYCKMLAEDFKLSTICLRFFNVFGERQQLDDDYSAVIPKFINCALNNEAYPVYGDGLQSRDFTYVKNVVHGIIAALDLRSKGLIMNLATGNSYTILLHLITLINKEFNNNIKSKFLFKREGDIYKSEADIHLATVVLPYKPSISFEEGLKRTIEYFKEKI